MLNIFFYHNRKYLLLGLYLLLSISFMISKSDKINLNIKSYINTVISPFRIVIDSLTKTVDNFWISIAELNILKKELTITKHQLEKLKGASIEIHELKRENAHLRTTLDIKTKIEYTTVYAEIIARDPSNYSSVFIINKGKQHGIKRNMPVVTYQHGIEGVVGKVIEVSKASSKILPITEIGSYIGSMLSALRYTGLIRGQGRVEEYLLFDYIDKEAV
ncbi:MAG: rod shape-determining protein MreC, partial [Spirochaetes bacterium]|nr:rod shape-determining protein MreC [Spirochaetota bacterium]